jgi:hypothetical protein
MTQDPETRGRALAEFYRTVAPRLFRDIIESGLLPADAGRSDQARAEWECFALYACVRGLVAAGGFNRETGRAIDALHDDVTTAWEHEAGARETIEVRRTRVSSRYSEYGEIGQAGGKSGAATVTHRLGEAAARHMTVPDEPPDGLAGIVGSLHEALVEGAAETMRSQE